MRPPRILLLLASCARAFVRAPRRRAPPLALAPVAELEAEFDRLARGQPVIVVDAAAAAAPIAELLEDGDLEAAELRTMWGPGARDKAAFVELCLEIDDLFEDEDDVAASAEPAQPTILQPAWTPDQGGLMEKPKPKKEAPAAPATPREALLAALPATCGYPDPEDPEDRDWSGLVACVEAVAELRDETARPDVELADALEGSWDLAFTSSPSFAFNKGFTGVAGTLPGGAEFGALSQTVGLVDGVDCVTYVEHVVPSLTDEIDVFVKCDWKLSRRFDALARADKVYLDCVPRTVRYGPVFVDGQRVERGWKSMRVLNSLAVEYIDDELRVMKGTTAYFVFRRRK